MAGAAGSAGVRGRGAVAHRDAKPGVVTGADGLHAAAPHRRSGFRNDFSSWKRTWLRLSEEKPYRAKRSPVAARTSANSIRLSRMVSDHLCSLEAQASVDSERSASTRQDRSRSFCTWARYRPPSLL